MNWKDIGVSDPSSAKGDFHCQRASSECFDHPQCRCFFVPSIYFKKWSTRWRHLCSWVLSPRDGAREVLHMDGQFRPFLPTFQRDGISSQLPNYPKKASTSKPHLLRVGLRSWKQHSLTVVLSVQTDWLFPPFQKQDEIKQVVACHLGLKSNQSCRLGDFSEWMHGTFNVCIPVYISHWNRRPKNRVLIRFPLPYKLGETLNPGNMDEKVRSEAATYIWMRQNCPETPIPYLWGFGIGNNLHVRAVFRNALCHMLTMEPVHSAWKRSMVFAMSLSHPKFPTITISTISLFSLHSS